MDFIPQRNSFRRIEDQFCPNIPVYQPASEQDERFRLDWQYNGVSKMVSIRLLSVALTLLSPMFAQDYVERDFAIDCGQAETAALAYLNARGFTEPECAKCPRSSFKAPARLLDAHGNVVGTQRMRRELGKSKTPFWLWSSPLHAKISLLAKPMASGCRLGLWIDFESDHTMVAVIIPVGERLGIPSNGTLESEYLDAIQQQPPPNH